MKVRITQARFHVLNMRTRMPFRYGIASLTALPHLFVSLNVDVDGRSARGLASDGLPPKWFTKNPDTSFKEELAQMLSAIRHAAQAAVELGGASSVFDLWWNLHDRQDAWGTSQGFAPLLTSLGTSLVERALIDGFCRAEGTTFQDALQLNRLGIEIGRIHPDLADVELSDLLPLRPGTGLAVRHTVGLTDPITDAAIGAGDRLDDGLPQSLAECVRVYGLRYLKIKLSGDPVRDVPRLREVAAVARECPGGARVTLDGNEQFRSVSVFREFWQRLLAEPGLESLRGGLIFVEQPLHRDVALAPEVGSQFDAWPDRPSIIIDESDDTLDSVRRALALGYAGASHKNCKGVFKGLANAGLISARTLKDPARPAILSSEDLANVGPVALLQDLTVATCLGITHSERNGHHYFRGLSMYPAAIQDAMLARHPDLYRRHERGFATLRIPNGELSTASLLSAPFGYGIDLSPDQFTPLDEWSPDSVQT